MLLASKWLPFQNGYNRDPARPQQKSCVQHARAVLFRLLPCLAVSAFPQGTLQYTNVTLTSQANQLSADSATGSGLGQLPFRPSQRPDNNPVRPVLEFCGCLGHKGRIFCVPCGLCCISVLGPWSDVRAGSPASQLRGQQGQLPNTWRQPVCTWNFMLASEWTVHL
jgi:hypothetical protein